MKIQDFIAFPMAYTAKQRDSIKEMSTGQKVASVIAFVGLTLLTGLGYLLANVVARVILEVQENSTTDKASQVAKKQFNPHQRNNNNNAKMAKPAVKNVSSQRKNTPSQVREDLNTFLNDKRTRFDDSTFAQLRSINLNIPEYFKDSKKAKNTKNLLSCTQNLRNLYTNNHIKDAKDDSPISKAAKAFADEWTASFPTSQSTITLKQIKKFDELIINYVEAHLTLQASN